MKARWKTCLAMVGVIAVMVGPAIAQTGGGTTAPGAGGGSPGPTNPQPTPAPAQPSAPSVGTAPGKTMPGKAQPGSAGQMPSSGASGAGQSGTSGVSAGSTAAPMNGQMSMDRVRSAQQALQAKGMDPGPVDGVIGPRTEAAIRAYQKDQALPQTGRLDDQTRAKLGVSQ